MRCASFGLVLASLAIGAAASANPQVRIAVGAGQGSPPRVAVYDGDVVVHDFFAYGSSFFGGVRITLCDVNGDGIADLVTAPAAGTGQRVQVYDGLTFLEVWGFYPFSIFHAAGIFVACSHINDDGYDDVVVGSDADAGVDGRPHVKVYDGMTRMAIADFDAFDPAFRGGVRVATGDVNGDGRADLVLGTGPGDGAVKAVDANGAVLLDTYRPYGVDYTHGLFVAAGDTDGDGRAEIVVAPDTNPDGESRVFQLTITLVEPPEVGEVVEIPWSGGSSGGIRVGMGFLEESNALADILFGPGPPPPPQLRRLAASGGAPPPGPILGRVRGSDGTDLGDLEVFDATFTGGVFVAAASIPTPEPDGAGAAAAIVLLLLACRSARSVARRSN